MTSTDSQESVADTVRADVVNLIKKQRLLRLVEGGRFQVYTTKGRAKDRYWLCKLSPNHRTLHYGPVSDNKDKTIDELPDKISVADIKRILVGKESQLKKTSNDLAFTIVYESNHEEYLNFVCMDQKTFSHWTDGLNVLINSPMVSEKFHEDLQMLTRIELKMRSISD